MSGAALDWVNWHRGSLALGVGGTPQGLHLRALSSPQGGGSAAIQFCAARRYPLTRWSIIAGTLSVVLGKGNAEPVQLAVIDHDGSLVLTGDDFAFL